MSNIVAPSKQSQQNLKDNMEQFLDEDSIIEEIKLTLKSSEKRITVNLRGFKFDLFVNSFTKYPLSRLAKLSYLIMNDKPSNDQLIKLCDHYDLNKMEFYYNNDPFIFNKILNLYDENNQKIHFDEGICFNYLNLQLDYWGFENKFNDIVDRCCQVHLNARKSYIDGEIEKEDKIIKLTDFRYEFKYKNFFPKLRKKLFNYIEYSNDSLIGKVF
jgi:hypothetical protein